MDNDSKKRLKNIEAKMAEMGQGLFKEQVELRTLPWEATWAREDIIIENQERIIQLLEQMIVLNGGKVPKPKPKPQNRMAKKIDSASYRDLQTMCKKAGLPAGGSAQALKDRLKEHHKV